MMIIDGLRARALISEDGDLLREIAARTEVAIEALTDLIEAQPDVEKMLSCARRAHYALLARHKDDEDYQPPPAA